MIEKIGQKYVEENSYYHNSLPLSAKLGNIDETKPTVVELFCGCGGTSLGFKMADFEILLGVDIHKPSIKTFSKNHENAATILGDIRCVVPQDIKNLIGDRKVNVLIGGVPCQGFSLNNKKRSSDDERNFLYKEFLRFVKELEPDVVIVENVSGMKSTKNGEFVCNIEKDIEDCGTYKVRSKMLNAADYGVPQLRNRLLFVGLKNGKEFDFNQVKKTHGEGTENEYVTVKEAIGDLPRLAINEEIKTYNVGPQTKYQEIMRGKNKKLKNHKAPNHPTETVEKIKNTKPGEPMYLNFKQRIRLSWNIVSPTQVSGGIRPQFQFGHPEDNRGLTIRERCRLQSFPDTFEVCGGIVQGRVQTGNAVPPLLAKAIANAVLQQYKFNPAED